MHLISKISSDRINKELSDLVNKNINKELDNMSPLQKKFIKDNIKNIGIDKLSELYDIEDITKKNNNYVYFIMKITIILLVIFFIVLIATSKLLCHKLPLKSMFIENIIIFTFVGIVHFIFFKYILLKYIPIEPSFIKKYLIETIKKQFA